MRFLLAFLLTCFCYELLSAQPIAPVGALPSADQLRWHKMEYYMFIHFGPNTFTNREWGKGDEDPKIFNPTQLDCRQWAAIARNAGMKGIIITAKHHDGFCLWPSQYSTHTVRESLWKDGKGDVLKELSAACKEQGLSFGVYLSPWDRNHPDYGTEKYNQLFVNMLGEVLGNYGEVFEQWFDGANGEGPTGKKQVYDWKLFNETVHKLQPHAIIFSDGGPGCRWVGNEKGIAGETNWCTLNVEKVYPAYPNAAELTSGHEDGSAWVPAECDVSIRPGWFYSPQTVGKVKNLRQLMDIYYNSIGRGGNLLLNVPVDRRGLIASEDSTRLMQFRSSVETSFKKNLARSAAVSGRARKGYEKSNLTDGDTHTSWAPPDGRKENEITIDFKTKAKFNRIVLQEDISLGQRVKKFVIEIEDHGVFKKAGEGTTIGNKRIVKIKDVLSPRIKITILESKEVPVLSEVSVYLATD